MKRRETYERRASFWAAVYFAAFSICLPVLVTGAFGVVTANPIVAIGAAVLLVMLYFAASNAGDRSQYWANRADCESRFETIETLDRPIWSESGEGRDS